LAENVGGLIREGGGRYMRDTTVTLWWWWVYTRICPCILS